MTRAFLYGLAVLLSLHTLWLGSLVFVPSQAIFLLSSYGGPFIAALVTAYVAPRDGTFMGTMMAWPATLAKLAVFWAYEATGGHVDAVGLTGALIVILFSLSIATFICLAGAFLGSLLAGLRSRRDPTAAKSI